MAKKKPYNPKQCPKCDYLRDKQFCAAKSELKPQRLDKKNPTKKKCKDYKHWGMKD